MFQNYNRCMINREDDWSMTIIVYGYGYVSNQIDRFDRWTRTFFMHTNAIREPLGDATRRFWSNRKNEYFRRRVLKREYLIFPRGRETRTRAIGAICFKNWSSRAPAIDILEEDSRDKWTLRRNKIGFLASSRGLMYQM